MAAIHELTALAQAGAVRAGEVSPTELAMHCLDRITAIDPTISAFRTVTEQLALTSAKQAERDLADARETGAPLSPLHGVPVAVKDVARIDGVVCTQGSATRVDDESDLDDHVVTRLKRAGMVIVGTTNTPEFALPCYTENELGAPTRNPWRLEYSPGGSSGGSAAAVAAGLVPLAHGTDAGGSVRIPASACGLVGIKPSRGRISNGPLGHEVTGLSTHGALGRTVEDTAALLDVMSGLMPGDTCTAPGIGDLLTAMADHRMLRVMAAPEPMLPDLEAHPDARAAVAVAVGLLSGAGHQVDEMELSPDPAVADAFGMTWSSVAARIEVDPDDEHLLTPFTRYMRERGRAVTGQELHEALSTFHGIGQMLADLVFPSYDVILTPTLAKPPARIGEFTAGPNPADDFDRMTAFMPYTPLQNITGLPAISVPLHWNDDGLPIGVMLTGRYGSEAMLAALAAELLSSASSAGRVPENW
ncbi:MAG TPA: amidase [Pseudonocardiaceae bacterium]|jgi:amidase|nr:amidase [Pseudonocardiaceae bacterium]